MRILFFATLTAASCFFSCQDKSGRAAKMTGLAGSLQDSTIVRVWPHEIDSLLKINPNIPIIDVRSELEYRTSHVFRSMNCDVRDSSFSKRILQLSRESEVILYDMDSSRSLAAAEQMRKLGFKRIYELAGGVFSWAREGKALVSGTSGIDSIVILK